MKKLIFFDIDGTIISEGVSVKERIIPDSFYDALHRLQKNGHICFVNTGRSYAEIETKLRDVGFDGFICGCGTYILYKNEALLWTTISKELGNQIIQDLETCHLEWLLEGKQNIYYSTNNYQTRIGSFQREHQILVPDAVRVIVPSDAYNLDFDKFCLCTLPDSDLASFQQKYQDVMTFIDRGNQFYEVIPVGYSKASGIQFLEKFFSIPHEDTIAIGDSTNDLPMLEYASYSIAMGNSAKELFPVVNHVTDSVLEDGIYHAMKHLKLI